MAWLILSSGSLAAGVPGLWRAFTVYLLVHLFYVQIGFRKNRDLPRGLDVRLPFTCTCSLFFDYLTHRPVTMSVYAAQTVVAVTATR